ncbi:hypothetical protein BDP27DRAFT_1219832 [Rhodocollybia butyracea]|uniref:F-box domain-containing protein n=1 Tax=Rhodocollybia butyracea TaxID=206335 RepID=A0A9P5PZM3_9AGAR|nr:hypothetical protein BDP27DRAFT_1219832 [Rhodocollybia butyracea]
MPEQFKRVRGRFGSLERLAKDIPLDIVFEIFAYLHPLDLLRLSRATKELRCILINKSSEHVWRTARQNVAGLPPLPHDLNEPQYAHLMFEPNCDVRYWLCSQVDSCLV